MSAAAGNKLRIARAAVVRALLSLYKGAISPALHAITPGACCFQPTCSEYAAIAIAEHGMLRGGLMALGRLLRCNPLHHGGFDPVPVKRGVPHLHQSGSAIPCVPQAKNR
jgi:putative membrane protein insertion efficiency factor